MKTPIFVLGAGGMLGSELAVRLGAKFEPQQMIFATKADLDVTDHNAVWTALIAARPAVVINCAAFTDVDGCETKTEHAMRVNATAPGAIAQACKSIAATLVHIGTDFVFDGRSRRAYSPESKANPLSAYGRSKWAGEEAIRASGCKHLIVRASWMFGAFGKNFVEAILARAESGQPLRVVNDQTGRPTHAGDLAEALLTMIAKEAKGTYHFANAEACTWNDFAKAIVEAAGISVEVSSMSTAELGRPATRPAYSVLDTAAYERLTGLQPRPWRAALPEYMNERLQPGSYALCQAIARTAS